VLSLTSKVASGRGCVEVEAIEANGSELFADARRNLTQGADWNRGVLPQLYIHEELIVNTMRSLR
jgi:glutaredoxin-related protein